MIGDTPRAIEIFHNFNGSGKDGTLRTCAQNVLPIL